ncbi:hypothetical protein [Kitasatospora terrestris]|uniref:SpdD protein n=1 Tax=Kitasatospora terrestris TaxID=258051 RepID=A0ABP9DSW0_9ACTN
MPRPSSAQLFTGTLIVVATTVALLAVSGSTGVYEIAVLVAFAIALGTLATALSMSAAAQRRSAVAAPPLAPAAPEPSPAPEFARQP